MLNVQGQAPYPLGVYKERPPEDQSFIKSYDVGGSIPARGARTLTSAANELNRLLTSVNPFPP